MFPSGSWEPNDQQEDKGGPLLGEPARTQATSTAGSWAPKASWLGFSLGTTPLETVGSRPHKLSLSRVHDMPPSWLWTTHQRPGAAESHTQHLRRH